MSEQAPDHVGDEAHQGAGGADVPTPVTDPEVLPRREELLVSAREATADRPGLARLVEQVARLDEVGLAQHVDLLDQVHRGLRDALSAAGRDEPPTP